MTKICSRCKQEFPRDENYFYKGTGKDGLYCTCKKCSSKYSKEYRQKNRERLNKYNREYRKENEEYWKKYNQENKERIEECRRKKYQENREHIRERCKLYAREYRKTHKEYFNQSSKKYRDKNKESVYKRNKKYKQQNREKYINYDKKRESRKRDLPATYMTEQWEKTKQYFGDKCAYCGKKRELTQDHFIPLSKGGEYTVNNIIPACQWCNASKHDKDFFKWYQEQSFYSKTRERKILKYLNYNGETQQLSVV
jgi:hypothetical protein